MIVEIRRSGSLTGRPAPVSEQSESIAIGDRITLDLAARLVRRDGRIVHLTPTEFALLDVLLRNPGRAFSRAYLLDTVWGQEYVGGDRSVDNAMLRLRKKLGPLGDIIETVWGVGYRLQPAADA